MNAKNTRSSSPSSRGRGRGHRRRGIIVWLAPLACAAGALVAVAQYRVNTQIYGNTSSSVRYGRSYQPSYANQPTYNLLPSENRNLIYRSGALPSTIRMNHAAVGPMAPQGVAAYVPEPQSFRSSAVAPGNYVNTISPARVTPMPAASGAPAPRPGVPGPAMPRNPAAAGSMRYAIPPAGSVAPAGFSMSGSAAPAPVSYSQMISGTPVNWTPQTGSIKYSH
jgi:hypothetical protein